MGWQFKIGKQWDFFISPQPNKTNVEYLEGDRVCPLMCPSHFRTHEVKPGTQVRSSIGVLLYAYIMCNAFSVREREEKAISIMQGTEEINLSVSAFNHH